MNTVTRLASTAMPGLSTDQTAYKVNRFITQRPALTSRPQTSVQRRHTATAPVPLEILYPSLYAKRSSVVQRCGDSLRSIARNLSNRLAASRSRSSKVVSAAK